MSDIIFEAVSKRSYGSIVKAVSDGVDLNSYDMFGKTPLIIAAENKDSTCVDILLASGADPNMKDREGKLSPMYVSIQKQDTASINSLLEKGVDLEGRFTKGKTLLHIAVEQKNKEMINLLLTKGADINAQDDEGTTPVSIATVLKDVDLVSDLVGKGADPNISNKKGEIPIWVAIEQDDRKTVDFLIKNGADLNSVDSFGRSLVLRAVEKYEDDLVLFLVVDQGADVNQADKGERFPLFVAVQDEDIELVDLLIKNGADINRKFRGSSMVDIAFSKGSYEIVDLLTEHGGRLENFDVVSAVERVVKLSAKQKTIRTSRDYQALMNLGDGSVDFGMKNEKGLSSLHIIIQNYNEKLEDLMHLILSNQADVNVGDDSGRTPLHYATIKGDTTLVKRLIMFGANPNSRDSNDVTPYQLSQMLANMKMFEVRESVPKVEKKKKRA